MTTSKRFTCSRRRRHKHSTIQSAALVCLETLWQLRYGIKEMCYVDVDRAQKPPKAECVSKRQAKR